MICINILSTDTKKTLTKYIYNLYFRAKEQANLINMLYILSKQINISWIKQLHRLIYIDIYKHCIQIEIDIWIEREPINNKNK